MITVQCSAGPITIHEPIYQSVETFSYSLFSYIPPNRTCQDADIESHWCTCQESHPISPNDTIVKAASQFAVNFINLQLEGYAPCALLRLYTIQRARVMTYQTEHITDEKSFKDYIITFTTIPGNATFEVIELFFFYYQFLFIICRFVLGNCKVKK